MLPEGRWPGLLMQAFLLPILLFFLSEMPYPSSPLANFDQSSNLTHVLIPGTHLCVLDISCFLPSHLGFLVCMCCVSLLTPSPILGPCLLNG